MLLTIGLTDNATTTYDLIYSIEIFWVFLVFLGLFVASLALVLCVLLCEGMPTVTCDADKIVGAALEQAWLVFRILFKRLGFLIELLLRRISLIHPVCWLLFEVVLWLEARFLRVLSTHRGVNEVIDSLLLSLGKRLGSLRSLDQERTWIFWVGSLRLSCLLLDKEKLPLWGRIAESLGTRLVVVHVVKVIQEVRSWLISAMNEAVVILVELIPFYHLLWIFEGKVLSVLVS